MSTSNESAFDVLMYLFESYLHDEQVTADNAELEKELKLAGFHAEQIDRAFDWLEGMAVQQTELPITPPTGHSYRPFNEPELARLDTASQGLLLELMHNGVLTPLQRERVIERLMALDTDVIDSEQTKWVILMVLFNQPGEEAAYASMEQRVLEDEPPVYH